MDLEFPDRWIRVRLESGPNQALSAHVEDTQLGIHVGPIPLGLHFEPSSGFSGTLADAIDRATQHWPLERPWPLRTGMLPLPIFLELPGALEPFNWEAVLAGALANTGIPAQRFQVVRLAPEAGRGLQPFLLPLRLLAVGQALAAQLDAVRRTDWFANSPRVQRYGLELHSALPAELEVTFASKRPHILVVEEAAAVSCLERLSRMKDGERPHLLVRLHQGPETLPLPSVLPLPPGVSLLDILLVRATPAEAMRLLLECLVHDYPLHEVTAALERGPTNQGGEHPPMLAILHSDPIANQSLRISDAFERAVRSALAMGRKTSPGDVDSFLKRVGKEVSPDLSRILHTAWSRASPIRTAVSTAQRLQMDFRRETLGMRPLAELQQELAEGQESIPEMNDLLLSFAQAPEGTQALQEHQERRVDIALYRKEYSPLVNPERLETDAVLWVNKKVALRQGARYRLRVLIGHPQPGSLMAMPPPPLDPLLPPQPGGHDLTVAVNGEDFTVEGPNIQPLHLPPFSASEPVDFTVLAPTQPGPAHLYVAVSYRGNVLQSFVLDTEIAPEEAVCPKDVLQARLLFSNTARFANLAELGPRALSIAVGEPRPGNTRVRMGDAAHSVSLRLSELMTSEQTAEYRRILEEATTDPQNSSAPRFLTFLGPNQEQKPGVEDVLRQLGRLGSQLYRAFYRQADTVTEVLDELVRSEDKTLQILRFNDTQTFPWAALYDFPEPEERVGSPAPVCLGYTATPEDGFQRCSCPQEGTWCARGFWGFRHRIEELVGSSELEDSVRTVARDSRAGLVAMALGTRGQAVEEMVSTLSKEQQLAVDLPVEKEDVLSRLWQPDRPGIFIVLGHMALKDAPDEPRGPRIVLVPGKKWLQDKKVTDLRRMKGRWDQPRTLVMVLACTSGTTEPATVNDFALAFRTAGAAAVVGTECTAFSGFLARFATEVTRSLLGVGVPKASLGEAITRFRRQLLSERNPLGFVFNAIGNADLTIA